MKQNIIYNQELFNKALIFATKSHSGQTRKNSGKPYIIHPISVMKILYSIKSSSNNIYMLAIACLLHDVVEDCKVSLSLISRLFGYQIAAIVQELTTDKDICENIGKTEYLKNKMSKMSSYSLLIKLADRLDNSSDLLQASDAWSLKYIKSTIEILNHIESTRKLTGSHLKLISRIRSEINNYYLIKNLNSI